MIRRSFAALICIVLIVLGTARAASRPTSTVTASPSFLRPGSILEIREPSFPSPLPVRKPHREVSLPAPPVVQSPPIAWNVNAIDAMILRWFTTGGSTALRIADCESGDNPNARNPSGATGVFQILGGPTDPWANIRLAWSMSDHGTNWQPWSSSEGCWA